MKFSIVIPVYDVAPYLRACLDSVLAQTCGDWEAVCVDDGSSDGSGAILDGYAARDGRFIVLHQPNAGVGAARNAALARVRGEWVGFLDADDLYDPQALAVGARLIAEHPECDVVGVSARQFMDGEPVPRPAAGGEATHVTDVRTCVAGNRLVSGAFVCGFYRRDRLGDVRFGRYLVGEDRVYAVTCLSRSGSLAFSEAVGYLYRQRATSVSHLRMSPRKAQDAFLHVAEMLEIVAQSGKTLERSFHRKLVAQILEQGAANQRQLPPCARADVRRRWLACVRELAAHRRLTAWGAVVAAVVRVLPFEVTVRLLCELPHRLKRAGIHR